MKNASTFIAEAYRITAARERIYFLSSPLDDPPASREGLVDVIARVVLVLKVRLEGQQVGIVMSIET
jgi:hypothetical protein